MAGQVRNYTYTDDDKGWIIECEVEATIVPERPAGYARMVLPPEGGYLEDVSFEVCGFKLEVRNHVYDVTTTPELREALAQEVLRAYDNSPDIQDEVYRKFVEV